MTVAILIQSRDTAWWTRPISEKFLSLGQLPGQHTGTAEPQTKLKDPNSRCYCTMKAGWSESTLVNVSVFKDFKTLTWIERPTDKMT